MSALDRRTALLDAAVGEIASRGTRGMRIERVARAAGVSPALIYHHFGDRSTLLQHALEHIGARAETYTTVIGADAHDTVLAVLLAEIQDIEAVRTNSAAWGDCATRRSSMKRCAPSSPRSRLVGRPTSRRWRAPASTTGRSPLHKMRKRSACS